MGWACFVFDCDRHAVWPAGLQPDSAWAVARHGSERRQPVAWAGLHHRTCGSIPKLAALGGVAALLAALFGFYDAMRLAIHSGVHATLHVARVWVVAALLCGPIYGVWGYLWRTRRSGFAVVALAAPLVAEPVAWLARIHPLPPRFSICLVESIAGVVMGWVLLKSGFLSIGTSRATEP